MRLHNFYELAISRAWHIFNQESRAQVKMQMENEIIRAEHSRCQLLSRLDARYYADVQGLPTAKHKSNYVSTYGYCNVYATIMAFTRFVTQRYIREFLSLLPFIVNVRNYVWHAIRRSEIIFEMRIPHEH